jgi:hypothetical protein
MSSSFSQTLNSITLTKLREVSRQLSDFNAHRDKVLSSVAAARSARERVQVLLDGINAWRSAGAASDDASPDARDFLLNVKKFLVQAERDPDVGEASLRDWEADFTTFLDTEKSKYEYAELFGRLLREWIASPTSVLEKTVSVSAEGEMSLLSMDDSFERIGRKEMHEQRAMFESIVFTAKETDTVAIAAYLEELFSSKPAKERLESMRKGIREFGEDMLRSTKLTVRDLELTINSLLVADLLSNEKGDTLKEFAGNPTVLAEVADVLNMHLASLTSWSWISDGDAVPVEMRRQLNGKYRVYMDEEILQAIFLHWIGIKWAAEFKRHFKSFFESRAWKRSTKALSKDENERREYFLGEDPGGWTSERLCGYGELPTIDAKRRADHAQLFFMTQLPESLEQRAVSYDAEDEGTQPTAVGIKQSLLHILATECLFNTTLYNEFTVVRSDFAWFGPSLPHSSIISVLRFFGVSEVLLTFFQKFLSAPLKFVADGPSAAPQTRKRGIPMSHSLGDCFGEVLLFCMDYAVNQRADGLFLYRINDDFWLWNRNSTVCAKAWQAMSTFTDLVGLEFNYEKTGSVSVGRPLHPDLPKGSIKWGFLQFEESGQFVIDQAQVDVHIDELKLQLKACEHSVFAWVQAYNKYVATFFVNNFGSPPAQCFGQRHVDMVIDTLQRIHLALFPEHGGSVIQYLAHVIQERCGVRDTPPGWFLWPMAMGGLEVKSPLIPQFAIRDHLCVDPAQKLKDAVEKEKDTYTKLQEDWDSGTTARPNTSNQRLLSQPFLSYEEYALHREERLTAWQAVYTELLEVPPNSETAQSVAGPSYLTTELRNLSSASDPNGAPGICSDWDEMTTYWRWVVACYGKGMVKKWGGLEVVRPGSLPLGMVEVWKSRKMRWEQ